MVAVTTKDPCLEPSLGTLAVCEQPRPTQAREEGKTEKKSREKGESEENLVESAMLAHTHNPSTWEVEAEKPLRSEVSLVYIIGSRLSKNT